MAHSATAGRAAGAALAVLLLAGCSDQLGDRGGKNGAPPDRIGDVDYVEVFRNADNFPNIARICVEGLAFASTSSGSRGEDGVANPALIRVPEWDAGCAAHAKSAPRSGANPTPTSSPG
ncbi:hypothetical protein GCM10027187_43640 [Streptosporangium sandarakinum]|uniref:Uncharacterized protein n=1 Tax=Streptosporangium sandarakinum TaxID=1260955 RepID=A0A852V613_9ACTN|nr:hypothetical protein [Streptosporangium sandarakinum]NYF43018.1 hypothetical protein [Streptosporangium sandarakinum]